MKSLETKKNFNYLKEHEKEFQEILYKEKERVPNTNELQKVMQNIADNLSFDEISHIFNEENNEEVSTKINEILLNFSGE